MVRSDRAERLFSGLLLAALVTVGLVAPQARAETTGPGGSLQSATLSPAELRSAAVQAITQRRPDIALRMSDALLGRDPADADARIIRARALRDLGRTQEAITAARAAWQVADTQSRQYTTAKVMAQALSSNGNRTRAQFWLRRAAQLAPTERHKAATIRDFAYVRAQNPLQLHLGFNVAPSSNINNGSIHASSPLFGWPIEFDLHGSARALSGYEISGYVNGRYRLIDQPRRIDEITFRLQHTGYILSEEARDYLDGVAADTSLPDGVRADAARTDGGDFASTTLALGYAHTGVSDALRGPYRIEASLGQTWYGGDPLVQFAQLGARQTFTLGPGLRAHLGLSHEWQRGQNGRDDARHWNTSAGIDRILAGGHRLSLGVDHTRASSDSTTLAFRQTTARARLALARPILNTALEFGLSAGYKHYPVSIHSADGRKERIYSADITATFRSIEFYGFSPSLTASFHRTDANVPLYDREHFGLRLGIRSSF